MWCNQSINPCAQLDDIINIIKGGTLDSDVSFAEQRRRSRMSRGEVIVDLLTKFMNSPVAFDLAKHPLVGDPIIQIGATVHSYGEREVSQRYIFTLGTCAPPKQPGQYVLKACATEREVLLSWAALVKSVDPDVLTGYNIFGFDMKYVMGRIAESETDCQPGVLTLLNRLQEREATYDADGQKLSSSALGDNVLYNIKMAGRVSIDLMKIVQRDHKLDSYKLDDVALHFVKKQKHDVSPQDIFRFGGAAPKAPGCGLRPQTPLMGAQPP